MKKVSQTDRRTDRQTGAWLQLKIQNRFYSLSNEGNSYTTDTLLHFLFADSMLRSKYMHVEYSAFYEKIL